LVNYLLDPTTGYPATKMPHFRLDLREAESLAAYLVTTAKREFSQAPDGDPTRGAQLLVSAGCLQCHAGMPPATAPTLDAVLTNNGTGGCVLAGSGSRTAPAYDLTPEDRSALTTFLKSGAPGLLQDTALDFAKRQTAGLRCGACHAFGSLPSGWSQHEEAGARLIANAPTPEAEGAQGSEAGGLAFWSAPPLTWAGEKLRPEWSARFIAGEPQAKPRPWLTARMPGFRHVADQLAAGFAHRHGFSEKEPLSETASGPEAEVGGKLIGETEGFNCRQCHAVRDEPASSVFEAPGINLGLARERLRPGFFTRWLLHPTRVDPETKMPKFVDDDGKTPLSQFFEGDGRKQISAMWEYLQSLRTP
jgi:hypothetical protein